MKQIIIIICIAQFIFSQHNHGGHGDGRSGIGFISGQIVSASNGGPIEYASVSLISTDTNEIEMGQLSGADGRFSFKEAHMEEYIIEISFMGFETWISEEINISYDSPRKDLGIIELKIKIIDIFF